MKTAGVIALCTLTLSACGPLEDDQSVDNRSAAISVSTAASWYCSTSSVKQLSQQLIDEVQCIRPNTMSRIDNIIGVSLGAAVFPYLQQPAARALARAAARRSDTLYVTSALRTLPQQYLLRSWYDQRRCGISLAAYPGNSAHESGLALDVSNYGTWRWALQAEGFSWFGASDPWHYDYYGGGISLGYLSVLAFQRLWNRNNPGDRITEDGSYGWATSSRLARAPAEGFAKGAICTTVTPPPLPPPPTPPSTVSTSLLAPIEIYWARQPDGSYHLRALAPSAVASVTYHVDGHLLSPPGKVTRAAGHNFPGSYTFSVDKLERELEVRGYDSSGKQIGLGVGLLDVTAGTAVYIKQMGAGLYEIGLERAPAGVAALRVYADNWLLTDSVTGAALVKAPRLAVRSSFNQLGSRSFSITTYNADGSTRGTLKRTFTLR